MVKIQLSTGFLDVKEGTAFPLNFQVGDIRDVSQRKGNFSKTITLTGSKNNNNLLNHYYDVNIVEGTFNINALTTCAVIQDGIPIMEDCSMQLTGLGSVISALKLSKKTLKIIRLNMGWALIYNVIGIPIAAAGLLSPLYAAAAMAASSVLVVTNSLRIK